MNEKITLHQIIDYPSYTVLDSLEGYLTKISNSLLIWNSETLKDGWINIRFIKAQDRSEWNGKVKSHNMGNNQSEVFIHLEYKNSVDHHYDHIDFSTNLINNLTQFINQQQRGPK